MPTDAPTPDPFPVTAFLRAATERALIAGRYASQGELAAAAGLTQPALSRALSAGFEARPSTVRAVLRACGMRLELVPEKNDSGPEVGA